jgi:hypothetical protein
MSTATTAKGAAATTTLATPSIRTTAHHTQSSSLRKSRSFRTRCGECEACVRQDCGSCNECVRKKKFGGDGSSKQACVHRRCSCLQERSSRLTTPSNNTNSAVSSASNKNSNNKHRASSIAAGPSVYSGRTPSSTTRPPSNSNSNSNSTRFIAERRDDLFPLPASLLEERSIKRARLNKTLLLPLPSVKHQHMCGLPIPEKKIGVCGRCGEDEENENETILLCDGEGYVRETASFLHYLEPSSHK